MAGWTECRFGDTRLYLRAFASEPGLVRLEFSPSCWEELCAAVDGARPLQGREEVGTFIELPVELGQLLAVVLKAASTAP